MSLIIDLSAVIVSVIGFVIVLLIAALGFLIRNAFSGVQQAQEDLFNRMRQSETGMALNSQAIQHLTRIVERLDQASQRQADELRRQREALRQSRSHR